MTSFDVNVDVDIDSDNDDVVDVADVIGASGNRELVGCGKPGKEVNSSSDGFDGFDAMSLAWAVSVGRPRSSTNPVLQPGDNRTCCVAIFVFSPRFERRGDWQERQEEEIGEGRKILAVLPADMAG